MTNHSDALPAYPGNSAPALKLPSTWRINHPEDAGGPTYVTSEPSPGARASFLRIGVTITAMYDGPLDWPAAAPNTPGFSMVMKERARVAGVLLTTIGGLEHFKDEPHWRRQIENVARIVSDMAAYLDGGSK